MTLSPLILLLLGVLAYRTFKGEGRLAQMLARFAGTASDATPAAPPAPGYPQRGSAPVPPRSMTGMPYREPMRAPSGGLGDRFGGSMGAFAGGMAGGLLAGGLRDLLGRFQQNGYGDVAQSWIGTGPNQSISTDELQHALGTDTVSSLAQEAGLSDIDVLTGLSQDLPGAVDDLTPTGDIADDY
jgi:uncharacterized protein YidB (DUF937 family)